MKPSRRRSLLSCLMAVTVAVLSLSCSKRDDSPAGPARRLLIMATFSKAVGNAPYHIAHHFQWFERHPALQNFRFEYREFNDRPTISDSFDKGELHILFSGDAPAILCKTQGNDIRLVSVSGNANQEILVPSSAALRSIPDLRGKTVAVLQATSSHFCLLKLLRNTNMAPADINLIYMPPTEAKTAFETGRLDAWAVWAPWVEQQELAGTGRVLPGSDALINSIMTVHSSLLTGDPEATRAIAAVIQRAKRWIISNPAEAQAIAAAELGLDPKVLAIAWKKFNWSVELNDTLLRDLQEKADFLAAQEKTRLGRALNVREEFAASAFVKR